MIALLAAAAVFQAQTEGSPVWAGEMRSGRATYSFVTADLPSGRVTVNTALESRLTNAWKIIRRNQEPAAAITGTFFAWETQQPVGDVLVDGRAHRFGARGSVIAIDWQGQAGIFDSEYGRWLDWRPFRFGLRGTVRLIRDGKVDPNPQAQRFRDRAIWGRAARTAAGIRANGVLVLCATRQAVSLSELGEAMRRLGAVDAVNLDGGGSTMLYYRGRMLIPTRRGLCNLLTLHERSPIDALAIERGRLSNEAMQER